jgi:MFS family permease
MVAVPLLASLTDRIDARRLLLAGSLASAGATIAFGFLAQGLWSAMLLWALAGAGFAGAYMPGLRALTDRLDPGDASRSVTLYTASYSLGVGLSFLVSQVVADAIGWRWAFAITGLGPMIMVAAAAAILVSMMLWPWRTRTCPKAFMRMALCHSASSFGLSWRTTSASSLMAGGATGSPAARIRKEASSANMGGGLRFVELTGEEALHLAQQGRRVFALGGETELRTEAGGEHHEAHDALAVHGFIVL